MVIREVGLNLYCVGLTKRQARLQGPLMLNQLIKNLIIIVYGLLEHPVTPRSSTPFDVQCTLFHCIHIALMSKNWRNNGRDMWGGVSIKIKKEMNSHLNISLFCVLKGIDKLAYLISLAFRPPFSYPEGYRTNEVLFRFPGKSALVKTFSTK